MFSRDVEQGARLPRPRRRIRCTSTGPIRRSSAGVHGTAIWEATPEGSAAHTFRTALFGNHPYHLVPPAARGPKGHRARGAGLVRCASAAPPTARWSSSARSTRRPSSATPEGAVRLEGRTAAAAATARPPPPAARRPSVRVPAVRTTRRIRAGNRPTCASAVSCRRSATPRDRVVNALLADLFEGRSLEPPALGARRHLRARRRLGRVRGGTAWFSGRVDVDAKALPEGARAAARLAGRGAAVAVRGATLRAGALGQGAAERPHERDRPADGVARCSAPGTWAGSRRCSTTTRAISRA